MDVRTAFAASILRRFHFIPEAVAREDRTKYRIGICVSPSKARFVGTYKGLNGYIEFAYDGKPYIHTNNNERVEGAYLNAKDFNGEEVADICNGLDDTTWAKPDVLQSIYFGNKDRMCYGLFAAGLASPDIYMSAVCTLIAKHGTFVNIEKQEEHPMLALLVLGVLVGPREHHLEPIYTIAAIPTCMAVVVETVKSLKEERPELLDKFERFFLHGVVIGKFSIN